MGPVYQPQRRKLGDAGDGVDPRTKKGRSRLLREIAPGYGTAAVADGGNAWDSTCEQRKTRLRPSSQSGQLLQAK